MPLTDLLEMTNEKVDAIQERASNSYHPPPSSKPETDFCELVWEHGQITVQGQSSKARNGPLTTNDYQSLVHNPQGGRDVNGLKMNKFSAMDSVLCDMGLAQDVDILPWLSYSSEDPLHNDYTCDYLPELSGITMNDVPTDNFLAFGEKKSGRHGDGHPNASKGDSNTVKNSRGETTGVAQFLLSSQHNVLKSGVSDITGDYVGNLNNVDSRDVNASSLCAFTRSRLQKLDAGQPSTSSSFTNFPYFSRSAALVKANHGMANSSKRPENDAHRWTVTSSIPTDSTLVNSRACSRRDIGVHNKSVQAPVDNISRSLPRKPTEEVFSAKRTSGEEGGTNDAAGSKVGKGSQRNMEPAVAASSVCSGNSVDRASNERGYDLKRKSRETTESEGPSDEVEDESVGVKKVAHPRASSKRSRAAEVHNLSERKRRDRINEKMRALQELIPNCNKVDKASMLDEAIDYLKTLQLQVQMMSMGAGLYMQPMMLPPGMQPIHGAQMPHFSPMMGMGMGFGMNMLDMNMLPFQGPRYPVPGTPAQYPGIPSSSLQTFGHLGQSLQTSMQQPPLTVANAAPVNIPMGLNVSGVPGSSGGSNLVPLNVTTTSDQQVQPSNFCSDSMNQATTNQATNFQPSPSSHDRKQNANAPESSRPGTSNDVA